ncbi:kinetochore protein Spc25 [Aspergillus luchuensis]|uniref:Kinetochore protein Spc25 n=1 Tax=Aspergillus kawachii TaxID=1069201 RepID=A0A146FDR3_ASPKA|nr:kinetochore protein Spc25 [Aspergillus luchuensis]
MQRTQGKILESRGRMGLCKAEKDTKVMLNDAETLDVAQRYNEGENQPITRSHVAPKDFGMVRAA